MATFVGILEESQHGGLLRPRGQKGLPDIFIPERALNGAPFGQLVVVETEGEALSAAPRGRVVEVLGDPARPDVAIEGIIRAYRLHPTFSREETEAAARVPKQLTEAIVAEELGRGRRDLRRLKTLTIDGKEAKDLDDAISIEALPKGGYCLWVHIADVAHYVPEGGALDRAALLRGNSVYLADRVLPMLPPRLSNGICSLNPGAERLALSCRLRFDAAGHCEEGEVFESLIRSDLRANYEDVYRCAYLGEDCEPYRFMREELTHMKVLARLLKARREARGCLSFDFPETKVEMNADGTVADICPYPTNEANGMIEEFMIAANVFVAKRYHGLGAPFLYRVHEEPDALKMRRFLDLAASCGLKLGRFRANDAKAISALLERVKAHPAAPALGQLLLQALPKARYDGEELGHFGLAEPYYSHFTSPIRRYPDLFIHRVIKAYLNGRPKIKLWRAKTEATALHCSQTERDAMYAEFASVEQKIAEFMAPRVGECFVGRIVGIMSAGVFVRLPNTAEGLLPFRYMDEYYRFDDSRLVATAERSGKTLRIGQEIEVLLVRADTLSRQLDFAPAGSEANAPGRPDAKDRAEARGAKAGKAPYREDKRSKRERKARKRKAKAAGLGRVRR